MLARKRDFGPVNLSRVTRQSGNTNPREKMMSRSGDIRDEKGLSAFLFFLHLPKDTCATDMGQPSRL